MLLFYSGANTERRPWVFKRVDRPKGVPNALAFRLRRMHHQPTLNQIAKLDRKQFDIVGGKERDPLHEIRNLGPSTYCVQEVFDFDVLPSVRSRPVR